VSKFRVMLTGMVSTDRWKDEREIE